MPLFNIDDERRLRAEIVADLETIAILGNIFDRRRMISSKKDFVDKMTVDTAGPVSEVRYTEIELVEILDSPDEGFDDCPIAGLTYNLHLFHEFADERSDGSNSDKDFVEAILRLRNFFLNKRSYDSGTAESDPIEYPEFFQFGNDGFTDCKGHFTDLTLRINYKYD